MAKVRNVEVVAGETSHATPGTAVEVEVPMRDAVGYYVTPTFVIVQSKAADGVGAFSVGAITAAAAGDPATVEVFCDTASVDFDVIAFNTDSLI